MKLHQLILIGLIAMCFAAGHAVSAEQITSTATASHTLETTEAETARQSAKWGISGEEWRKYKEVMASRRGMWTPGLDPLTALGVTAETTAERRHFAELYVRAEFQRVRNELAFQSEVDQAWARLYPETPRLLSAAASVAGKGRTQKYGVVVSIACGSCGDEEIRKRLDSSDTTQALDIHIVGSKGSDKVLRQWIADRPWLRSELRGNRATVNHGEQFADIAMFPAVYAKKEGGKWVREL